GGVFCQSTHHRLIQSTRSAIIDVFHAGRPPQLGCFQSSCKRLILAPVPLLIDQQSEPFQKAQFVGSPVLLLRLQSFDHALQPHGQQFVHHRLVQHEAVPPWSKYSAPRTLSCVKGGGLGGGGDRGMASSEFFKMDFTLWYRHAPARIARSAAASTRGAEYCPAKRMMPRQER